MPISYITKINQRTLGVELLILNEQHIIGTTGVDTSSLDVIRLTEVPLQELPSSVAIPGFTEVLTAPGTNEYLVDYENGRITFHTSRNGETVFVTYKGRGSIVDAEDINELQIPVGVALDLDGEITAFHVKPISISNNPSHNFTFPNDLTVNGNLDVKGTVTSLQTETVTIDDNIILLNSNVTGVPTEDSGIEIERGSSPNVKFLWDETLKGWSLKDTSDNALLTALDSREINILGSTIFGVDSVTDPASITVSQIDIKSGVVVTTTGAVILTMPTPTNTLEGRFFTVVHKSGSSGSLTLDGKTINVSQGTTLMWDGTSWTLVGGGAGGFSSVVGDPVSPSTGDTWFNTLTNQFSGYNGTDNVILG